MLNSPMLRWQAIAVTTTCLAAGCSSGGGGGSSGGGHATVGPATLSTQVVELQRGFPGANRASCLAIADVDGDGDRDAFLGNQLYRNVGGVFEAATAGSVPGSADHAAFGDVDGDGDVDLFVSRGTSRLWINDGSGRFADVTASALLANANDARHVVLGDVDRDGDLDAVVGTSGGQDRLYLNNGVGVFTDGTSAWLPAVATLWQMALADFDGDGDLDLIARNGTQLLRNTGSTFVVDPAANLPTGGAAAMAVADLDGDGDLDVVMSRNWLTTETNFLLQNDGAGHFTDRSAWLPQGFHGNEMAAVAIGDVDGDGDQDVVIADQGQLLENDGTAHFTVAAAGDLPTMSCYSLLAFDDIDGDLDLDLLVGFQGNLDCLFLLPHQLFVNDGQGRFRRSAEKRRGPTDGIAVDVDGDLDLDVIRDLSIDLNDGTGAFSLVPSTPGPFAPRPDGLQLLDVGDVDGDGDADAVFGFAAEPDGTRRNRIYANDGHGQFTALPHPVIGETRAGRLGDLDGDGDLDLVLGRAGAFPVGRQTLLLVNDGHGGFLDETATRMPVDGEHTTDLALGDIDRDGDLDLVLASRMDGGNEGRIRIYLNSGAGVFTDVTARQVPSLSVRAEGVLLADLEGDGDLDILISALRGPSWYQNRGNGLFIDASAALPFAGQGPWFHAARDLDGDGDADLAVGIFSGVSFFLQDAPGVFREDPASRLSATISPLYFPTVHAIDVDGDGDVEWAGKTNLARHLVAPGPATIGRPWRLDAYARPGWLLSAQMATIHLSFASATLPRPMPPYGVFHLDPAASTTLPPLVIPAPLGRASAVAPIPNDPALLAQPVHAQALITDPATGIGGFTNLHRELIGP